MKTRAGLINAEISVYLSVKAKALNMILLVIVKNVLTAYLNVS